MNKGFDKRFNALVAADGSVLAGGLKGVEKESLRVDANGYLSKTRHPVALGSALTNGFITTDFSEALLEFITPAYPGTWEALQVLCDIHQFTYARAGCRAAVDGKHAVSNSCRCRDPAGTLWQLQCRANEDDISSWTWPSLRQAYANHRRRALQLLASAEILANLSRRDWQQSGRGCVSVGPIPGAGA